MARLDDLTGRTFGRLTVSSEHRSVKRRTFWTCQCDCGNLTEVTATNLKVGNTKSCGCFRRDFTTAKNISNGRGVRTVPPPEYGVWGLMRGRCQNQNNVSWPDYGGRGITVCDRWQSFDNFYADMGPRPTADHQIDRVDNDGPYSPENCQWSTRVENCSNRRDTVNVEWRGETATVPNWSRRIGIPSAALWARLNRLGWDVERAMTTPVRQSRRNGRQAA